MRKSHTSKMVVLAALGCAFSTACSSGGGGGTSQAVSTGTSTNMTSTTQGIGTAAFDTGIAGSVAAPAAATFGAGPAQLATSGGPSFDGSSGSYPSNVTFPLIISSLQKTSTGLSPAPSDPGATLTLVRYFCSPCTSLNAS